MSDQRFSLVDPAHSLEYRDNDPVVELMVLDGNVQIGKSLTLTARDIKNIVTKLVWQVSLTRDLPASEYAQKIGLVNWIQGLDK